MAIIYIKIAFYFNYFGHIYKKKNWLYYWKSKYNNKNSDISHEP